MKKRFEKVLQDIKDVKIQGANNIALAGIKVAANHSDRHSLKRIISMRPTEPLLQNSLEIISISKNKKQAAKILMKYIKNSKNEIAVEGSKLIRNNMNVFSHCHSSTVIDILKYAKKKRKKNFFVYTTEVEPLLQGRQTAQELAKAGIKVFVFPDLAAEQAMKNCDLFLFGSDAYTKSKIVNKIGTSTLCKIAKLYKIPRYTCGLSLKFTKKVKLEKRNPREVWDAKNNKIKVINLPFDATKAKDITGIISEFGITPYKIFVKKAKRTKKILSHLAKPF